jgi:hypothetical protein
MKTCKITIWFAMFCLAFSQGCVAPRLNESEKIMFQLDNIHSDGLRGPPDGWTSVTYEFCVPTNAATYEAVRKIDPSVKIYPGGRGRIRCSDQQALCIGQTQQPNWRRVLMTLAAQPYIAEIRECFFE